MTTETVTLADLLAEHKHSETMEKIFNIMFSHIIGDSFLKRTAHEKYDLLVSSLGVTGKTLSQHNDDIENGIQKGVSVEAQLDLIKRIF